MNTNDFPAIPDILYERYSEFHEYIFKSACRLTMGEGSHPHLFIIRADNDMNVISAEIENEEDEKKSLFLCKAIASKAVADCVVYICEYTISNDTTAHPAVDQARASSSEECVIAYLWVRDIGARTLAATIVRDKNGRISQLIQKQGVIAQIEGMGSMYENLCGEDVPAEAMESFSEGLIQSARAQGFDPDVLFKNRAHKDRTLH